METSTLCPVPLDCEILDFKIIRKQELKILDLRVPSNWDPQSRERAQGGSLQGHGGQSTLCPLDPRGDPRDPNMKLDRVDCKARHRTLKWGPTVMFLSPGRSSDMSPLR